MSTESPEISYTITVEQNRIKRNQVTAVHLMIGIILLLLGAAAALIPVSIKTHRFDFLNIVGLIYAVVGVGLILLSIFFNKRFIQKPAGNITLRIIEGIAIATVIAYTLVEKWYLPFGYSCAALLIIVFAFLWERNGTADLCIKIDKRGVFIPGFFRKRSLQWQDVTRVLLKHTILTVDCHDNRLFQYRVKQVNPDNQPAEQFAQYCSQMIEEHKHLQRSDW